MFIKANKLLGLPLKTSRCISRGGRPAAQRDGPKKASFKMTLKTKYARVKLRFRLDLNKI